MTEEYIRNLEDRIVKLRNQNSKKNKHFFLFLTWKESIRESEDNINDLILALWNTIRGEKNKRDRKFIWRNNGWRTFPNLEKEG